MISLPQVQGRFPVGATTFVTPIRPARPIGNARLKKPRDLRSGLSDHALHLEEVAFTAYYPVDTSGNPPKGVDWLFRPLKDSLQGLSTYLGVSTWLLWPVVYLFGSLLTIPAYRNAPLLHPMKASHVELDKQQWPLVIFSHGLGGSRTTYSQYCSRLAASGKVVLALEHRDGTGMACLPRTWEEHGKTTHRSIIYLREADIVWGENKDMSDRSMPLRAEQLAFRHHEIYIMYDTFRRFIQGDTSVELETMDGSTFDKASWTSASLNEDSIIRHNKDVILAGHSFGGATILSLLATKPVNNHERIPISQVVLLDPWLEPLPTPGPAPYCHLNNSEGIVSAEVSSQSSLVGTAVEVDDASKTKASDIRMLVINSETFTLWKDHYARLQEIVETWAPKGRSIATFVGSQHISFSDFPILPGFRKKHAMPLFDNICRLSLAFIHDRLEEVLDEEVPTTDMKIEIIGKKPDGRPKRKLVGNIGDVIVS